MASIEARPRRRGTSRPMPEIFKYNNDSKSWDRIEENCQVSFEPPESLPAFQALCWTEADQGVDYRPHLFDQGLNQHLLVDSGSMVSAFPPDPGDVEVNNSCLKAVNGSRIKCYGQKRVSIKIGRKTYHLDVYKADVDKPVLGWDFIRKNRLDIVWNEFGDNLIVDKVARVSQVLEFRSVPHLQSRLHKDLAVSSTFKDDEDLSVEFQVASMQALSPDESVQNEDVSVIPDSIYKEELLKHPELLEQNFNTDSTKSGVVHRIKLKEDSKPFKAKVRRLLPGSPKAVAAHKAWSQLVQLGIVERVDPSKVNLYSSPLHFAPKPDNSLRPVGDYRLLNQQTELDVHPLPHLRDFVHEIAGCQVFSKVDLRKGFHQIVIDKRDRHLTTVTTPWGMFQFKRLSMGMSNSAQSFQRWVSSVVADIPGVFCYLDDLLIFSKDHDTHLNILKKLFDKLADAGMTLATDKCIFGVPELEYLGYKINAEGLHPIQRKIDALQSFPKPTKQKEVLAFLGALNYYRSSLPKLHPDESADPESWQSSRSPAAVLDPLYKIATCKLRKVKGEFDKIWSDSKIVQNAFIDAKTLLTKAVRLNYPVPSAQLALSTDASKVCLGASLDQWVNGAWSPLGFWSKSLRPEQQRYSTYRRELLAIKHAIRHFIHEINGRHLVVYTDHLPIIGSWRNPDLQAHDAVAMNALNEISQWVTDIRHRPGKDLVVPDLLSRPFGVSPVTVPQSGPQSLDPEYVPPEKTLAALQEVAINIMTPVKLAEAQQDCEDVKSHLAGNMPRGVKMSFVDMSGSKLYCEVSNPSNPRPLVPKVHRNLVTNLLHHQDHPSAKETTRRISSDYYWPCLKNDVNFFVKTCHPCQVAKQSSTVNPGTGHFDVPDKRFSQVHLDVVGPLPESEGMKYILAVFCRTSRWLECYPMRTASSAECCRAFLEWTSRYGLAKSAVSDNGNTFVANLYKDMMATFNIDVKFCPAYHPATNGAIERRFQTLKNSIKASLIDMGDHHGSKWMRALPWVMLGKRAAVQPDLNASAAMLTFGKSVALPGSLLGEPGPPLSNLETRNLLEELYKLDSKPAIQTSATANPIDISFTDEATHVYVKVTEPRGLNSKFEGPYFITSRPTRTTVKVRVGSFADGTPRLQVFNWSLCKIAHMRSDAVEGARPNLGRRPDPKTLQAKLSKNATKSNMADSDDTSTGSDDSSTGSKNKQTEDSSGAEIQTRRPIRSSRNSNPQYVDSMWATCECGCGCLWSPAELAAINNSN